MDYIPTKEKQEAQLPLRNRASAMHFFVAKLLSIAVMTYDLLLHLSANELHHATAARARDARPQCSSMFPF